MKTLDILLDVLAYEGVATADPTDSIHIKNKIQDVSVLGVIRELIQVANATVDQTVNLPATPSSYLIIQADQQISIKMNGGTSEVLTPKIANRKTLLYFKSGVINSLSISNASGAVANVDILIANK